eukprot:2236534-Prymnesium_polylepis.1
MCGERGSAGRLGVPGVWACPMPVIVLRAPDHLLSCVFVTKSLLRQGQFRKMQMPSVTTD